MRRRHSAVLSLLAFSSTSAGAPEPGGPSPGLRLSGLRNPAPDGTVVSKKSCYCGQMTRSEEVVMPVILLWGIPTLIVLGGGTYWLLHLHH